MTDLQREMGRGSAVIRNVCPLHQVGHQKCALAAFPHEVHARDHVLGAVEEDANKGPQGRLVDSEAIERARCS